MADTAPPITTAPAAGTIPPPPDGFTLDAPPSTNTSMPTNTGSVPPPPAGFNLDTPPSTPSPAAPTNPADSQNTQPPEESNPIEMVGDAIKNTADIYKNAPNTIFNDLTAKNGNTNPTLQGVSNGLQTTSDVMNTIFAPFSGLSKAVTDAVSKNIEANPALINHPVTQHIAQFVSNAGDSLNKLNKSHPVASKILGNSLALTLLGLGGGEEGPLPEKGVDTEVNPEDIVKGVQNVTEKLPQSVEAIKEVPGKIGESIVKGTTLADTPESLAGRMTGATGDDVSKVVNTLNNVGDDLKGTKNTPALLGKVSKFINDTLNKVDANLDDTNKIPFDKFNKTFTYGGTSITKNFVQDAFDDLKELYTKNNDPEGLARVTELEKNAKEDGITLKEANDLAREYGGAKKGFNLNGELSTSVTKQGYENTRMGIKGTVRDMIPDDVTKKLDRQASEAITTKELLEDRQEALQRAKNKIQPQSIVQKGTGKLGNIIDKASDITGVKAGVKSALGIGENGDTSLNIAQMEKNLPKNINKFIKLNK